MNAIAFTREVRAQRASKDVVQRSADDVFAATVRLAASRRVQGNFSCAACAKQPGGQITQHRVQPSNKKYFCLRLTQITCVLSPSRALEEGRIAIVTDVGAGCGGRKDAIDEQRLSGRQSRVVLTPRWQVSSSQGAHAS
jgi:hypothetical protein